MTDEQKWWVKAFGPGPDPESKPEKSVGEGCAWAALFMMAGGGLFLWWLLSRLSEAIG